MTELRCHFCQEPRDDLEHSPRDPEMWWCPPGDVECNFRARRRLGVPLIISLEAKARELEQLAGPYLEEAAKVRWRIAQILASEPPARTTEYIAHLGSSKWEAFAGEQKLLARHRCEGCGKVDQGVTVHHLDYQRLGREHPADVVVLCPMCHRFWDEARRGYYREHEYANVVRVDTVYGDLLTDEVRERVADRLERAAQTGEAA